MYANLRNDNVGALKYIDLDRDVRIELYLAVYCFARNDKGEPFLGLVGLIPTLYT